MNTSFRTHVIRGVSWTSIARFSEKGIGYIRIAILARLLSPADFGVFGIVLLILSLVETLSETGIAESLIQKKGEVDKDIPTVWSIYILRGLVLATLVFLATPKISDFFDLSDSKVLLVAAVVLMIRGFTNPSILLWRKKLEFKKEVLYQLAGSICEAIVAISSAVYFKSYWALLLGFSAKIVFQVTLSLLLAPIYKLGLNRRVIGQLYRFGRWINANSILSFATHEGDDIVVGKMLGTYQLGLYQNAYKFSLVPVTGNVFSHIAFPIISSQTRLKDKLEKTYKLAWAVAYVSFAIGGIIWLFPQEITLILLGSNWLEMASVLQILIIYGVLRSIGSILGQFFPAIGKPYINTQINLIKLCLVFIPLFFAINQAGLIGAAVVVVFASLCANAIQLYRLKSFPGFSKIKILQGPVLALGAALVIGQVSIFLVEGVWLTFVITTIAFLISYATVALIGDTFLRSLFTQLILPKLPKPIRTFLIKSQLTWKRGSWHDFDWKRHVPQATNKDWQERYDLQWQHDRHDSLLKSDINWIIKELTNHRAKTVLEIGPGTGQLSKQLHRLNFRVTVVDISQVVLRNLANHDVNKIQARAELLPLKDKSFDVIVATHLLEHVDSVKAAVAEWIRVSKRGLIIIVPQEHEPEVASNYHLHFFPTTDALLNNLPLKKYELTSHTNPNDNKNYFRYSGKIRS